MKMEVENYEYNYENYRDKCLNEFEVYDNSIQVACHQVIDDYSKLYYICSTYTQPGRTQEIERDVKLKESIERNK